MKMGTEYSTKSFPKDIKKRLKKAKGNKAFDKLADILTDEDLKTKTRYSKEFRENFALR